MTHNNADSNAKLLGRGNTPNEETQIAIAELEAGGAVRFSSVEALMADLNNDGDNLATVTVEAPNA